MERVRNAIINSRNSKKNNRIILFTIILFMILAGIEMFFLSSILNGKMNDAIEVFAPLKMEEREIALYSLQDISSYEMPKAKLIENKNIDVNKPMVALTFDDGPHPKNTIRILNTLSKYGAKATFFMLGENVEKNKEIPKKIIEQGSEIGTHTWDHKNLNKLDEEQIVEQITMSSKIIEESSGTSIKLLRPPYGNNNELVRSVAKSQEKAIVLWNIDTEDWKSKDSEKVYKHVIDNVKDGDIVLLHDIYSTTADATEKIVKELTEKGYQLVTISELFEMNKKPLNYGEKYYYCK